MVGYLSSNLDNADEFFYGTEEGTELLYRTNK